MFEKILIANRGEIACRIIQTARKMQIKTVAVYSQADQDALHVSLADEAVLIGEAPPSQSYLAMDKILHACKETGADAVHPGYGFLSERAEFASLLEDNGIIFIGPSSTAISELGDKLKSKTHAQKAGVPVVPGHVGEIHDEDQAVKIANSIGYPVIMKASAAGGGKGMRIAYSDDDVLKDFQSTRNEAQTNFGDDRVFIEKYIEDPRHIEIQVLGDKHGNTFSLHERECSIQRRYQKVVEEAPSPFVTPEMRKAMGEKAVALAKRVGYYSAGTVEFIVGADRSFYFLEMNTRLQVEHPVTEMITGLDLVEQMIRVAAGEKLDLDAEQIPLNGWAIETRVYAEDPYRNFLPSIGRLKRYQRPETGADFNGRMVRVDSGAYEGSEISMFYDPMISKLITHAPDRENAIRAQMTALNSYHIRGISHNIHFLSAVMQHEAFRKGNLTTHFIDKHFSEGFSGVALDDEKKKRLCAVALLMHLRKEARKGRKLGKDLVITLDNSTFKSFLTSYASNQIAMKINAQPVIIESIWNPGDQIVQAVVDGHYCVVDYEQRPLGWRLSYDGSYTMANVSTPREAELAEYMIEKQPQDKSHYLECPMPGMIIDIAVAEGDQVEEGQTLATIEAMKMENILSSERKTQIKKILVAPGDSVSTHEILIEFED